MSEQAKFQAWWDEKGFNSVILRAAAWAAWMARAELDQPAPPSSTEDPDEWVVQDLAPIRIGDRGWWVSSESRLPAPALMWVASKQSPSVDERRLHGEEYEGSKLHVMCRRSDLPKVEQPEQSTLKTSELKAGTELKHDGEGFYVEDSQ